MRAKSPYIPPCGPSNGPEPVSGNIGEGGVCVTVVSVGVGSPGGGGTTGTVGVLVAPGVAVSVGGRVPLGVGVGVSGGGGTTVI